MSFLEIILSFNFKIFGKILSTIHRLCKGRTLFRENSIIYITPRKENFLFDLFTPQQTFHAYPDDTRTWGHWHTDALRQFLRNKFLLILDAFSELHVCCKNYLKKQFWMFYLISFHNFIHLPTYYTFHTIHFGLFGIIELKPVLCRSVNYVFKKNAIS